MCAWWGGCKCESGFTRELNKLNKETKADKHMTRLLVILSMVTRVAIETTRFNWMRVTH